LGERGSGYSGRQIQIKVTHNTMLDKIKQNLTFDVSSPTDSVYAEAVASKIAKSGYSVKKGSPLKIIVLVNKDLRKSKGWYIYQNRVNLQLKSHSRILSSQIIKAKGISATKNKAYLQSVRKFSKQLNIKKLIFNE